jgi:hypothetical protein
VSKSSKRDNLVAKNAHCRHPGFEFSLARKAEHFRLPSSFCPMTFPSSHLRLVEPPAGADERFTHNRAIQKKTPVGFDG